MAIQKKKKNKTTDFLLGSFILLLLISAGAFLCLAHYMERVSGEAIGQVGDLYMTGMNERIVAHFRTLMDLKLEQAQAVVQVVPPDAENLYDELTYRVGVRNFDYLALCSQDGNLEMLRGEQIYVVDPVPFYESLQRGESKIAVGKDASGADIILLGICADYPMNDGSGSRDMVVAFPIEYISTMLDTEQEDSLMYSHIIRKDGSFITSGMNDEYADYFSSLYARYGDSEGVADYVRQLTAAMEREEDYSAILDLGGSRQQIYCTSLPYSEWHLVTVLPFGALNETVEDLDQHRTVATMVVFFIILAALLMIFYIYFKMTCRQLKELEAAREEALQATKAKSKFLSNMSHDIRTPMNAIVGMTAIAIAHVNDREQVQGCLKKIALSGKHLLGLINDVLDMSKIESGKMTLTSERISLREVVESIVSIVQTQISSKGQMFHVHINNITVENVYSDSVRLNQVLLNLLSNAVKYTQEGGTIELSLYEDEEAPPKGDAYVRTHIEVRDNGIGMTAEFLERIFDSYTRADSKRVQKAEGAGLGMAITKYIVNAMEGSITVESEPGKGTKFHVTLDLEKAEEQEADMVLPAWKMLVVDDDEILCKTAVESLDSIGIQADWTMSGEKAIEMVEKHHRARDDYQIILLDWKLPGMDGIRVARQIRHMIEDDMPIILISAYDWSEFEGEAREAGISGFISKPLFKSTLFYGLKKYMGEVETQEEDTKDMALAGRRILVAEDNELNWEIVEALLTDMGMELEWAENGRVCLEKFQESEQGYFDAVLMDIRMPVMNGYEATTAIRALERSDAQKIPIIAMTADAFAEDVKQCLDCGMTAHTSKPINLEDVIGLLKKYIL